VIATEIRVALNALEGILGHIGVEDLLGEIFSSFCIGK
jgi:tRNA modification GTPase